MQKEWYAKKANKKSLFNPQTIKVRRQPENLGSQTQKKGSQVKKRGSQVEKSRSLGEFGSLRKFSDFWENSSFSERKLTALG